MRGKDFVREMEALAAPIAKQAYDGTCETYANLSDDQAFRLLGQLWWLEGPEVPAFARAWWQSIPGDPTGKYRDVEMFLSRQLYDESRHGKLYAAACIQKGFVKHEQELYGHPYTRPVPGLINFTIWMQHLGNYMFTTLYTAEQLASENLTFPSFIDAMLRVIDDPIVRGPFEGQYDEERYHGLSGRYVVAKYCHDGALQEEGLWAAKISWNLLQQMAADLGKFVKDGSVEEMRPAPKYERLALPQPFDKPSPAAR
ncbi:MAG: hypothetical protein AB7V27_07600 [Candidatus Binatia bacterium]